MSGLDDTPITPRPADLVELPLTPLQRRWWFLCTQYPGGSSPLVSIVRRLRGPLDVEAWLRAVDTVVDRHEVLRAVFADRPTGPVQLIGPAGGLAVERLEVASEAQARELLIERRQRWLDLERGPLVHSSLLRIGGDDHDHVWALTIHHILADGASLAIIDTELSALYAGRQPAPLTVQYGDYAVWLTETPNEQETDDRDYWREQLADAPPLELRGALPRPAAKGAPAAELTRTIHGDLAGRAEKLALAYRGSRFMVLFAALTALLGRHSGQKDFCVGIPVAGVARQRDELSSVVGMFNNTIALRADLSGDKTFQTHLMGTRETVLDAMDHQDLAWGEVVAELQPALDPGRAQVFQAMFLFDELSVGRAMALPDLEVTDFALAIPKVLHDLMVFVWPSPQGLTTRWVYDTGILDAELVERLAADYESLLRAAIEDPERKLADLLP